MARALEFAWHDGALKPLSEVHISPLDRGFLFGDGVYEVIPVYAGRPLGMPQHLARLRRSLAAIALAAPMPDASIADLIATVVDRNGSGDQSVYLQISRRGDDGRDHRFPNTPESAASSLFVMSSPLEAPRKAAYAEGFSAITLPDERWQRCDIKATSLLANVLARQTAAEAGALEAILTRDGHLVEGAASAVMIARDGVLVAPPETQAILPSVTRALALEVAARSGVPSEVRAVSMSEARAADELLVLSSTRELTPIVTLDDKPIGEGTPGPIWDTLFDGYQELKETP